MLFLAYPLISDFKLSFTFRFQIVLKIQISKCPLHFDIKDSLTFPFEFFKLLVTAQWWIRFAKGKLQNVLTLFATRWACPGHMLIQVLRLSGLQLITLGSIDIHLISLRVSWHHPDVKVDISLRSPSRAVDCFLTIRRSSCTLAQRVIVAGLMRSWRSITCASVNMLSDPCSGS